MINDQRLERLYKEMEELRVQRGGSLNLTDQTILFRKEKTRGLVEQGIVDPDELLNSIDGNE